MPGTPVYSVFEGRLNASGVHPLPFAVWCWVLVSGPAASRHPAMNVSMFYDGGSTFAFRVAPDAVGTWHWKSECPIDRGLDGQEGAINCTPSQLNGGVVANGSALFRESGVPVVAVGLELDWLFSVALARGADASRSLIDSLAAAGINHLLVQSYSNYTTWDTLPARQFPRLSPTLVTPWASDDQQTLDLRWARAWDLLLGMLEERGVTAHMMLYVGNKGVVWPERNSVADDIYWRHCLARWGASSAILWDVSKEAGSYGIGTSYALDRLALISRLNPHGRLVTAHSGMHWSNSCEPEPQLCSMVSAQIHFQGASPSVASQEGQYYAKVRQLVQATPTTPVLNVEFFYQAGNFSGCNGSCCGGCARSTTELAQMRRVAWDSYMAGGVGAAWYHCDLSWDVIDPMAVSDLPVALRVLHAFWEARANATGGSGGYSPAESTSCATEPSPADATIHCMLGHEAPPPHGREGHVDSATAGSSAILHVRSSGASFRLAVPTAARGFWLDPTDGARQPFEGAPASKATTVRQPSTFKEDAILLVFW